MRMKGVIVHITEDGKSYASIQKHLRCRDCGRCAAGTARPEFLEVENSLGALPGQLVLLELPSRRITQAVLIAFGGPLLLFFLGYLFGAKLWDYFAPVAGGLIVGGTWFCFGLIGVHYYDRYVGVRKLVDPKVIRILKP